MQDLALQTHFDPKAAQPETAAIGDAPALRTDRVLNYVWINKIPDKDLPPPTDGAPLCSVPLHYLDKAYANARTYPDTEVRIWIDEERLSAQTRSYVQAHADENAPGNVRFYDLNAVPAYQAKQGLYADENVSIWYKVDLARFQVVEECLRGENIKTAYYADFDVKDVSLDEASTAKSLDRYGTAFARVPGENIPSPGYFAGRKEGLPTLGKIISAMEEAIRRSGDHYQAFRDSLPQSSLFALRNKFTDVVLPPENVQMPLPDVYRENGLCAQPPCKKCDLS